jgi:hypothetical protein
VHSGKGTSFVIVVGCIFNPSELCSNHNKVEAWVFSQHWGTHMLGKVLYLIDVFVVESTFHIPLAISLWGRCNLFHCHITLILYLCSMCVPVAL